MRKFSIFIACILLLTFACGAAAAESKTFYWYDMMEKPHLKYRQAHGLLSYYVQPFEFAGVQPVTDNYAQRLELTLGLSGSAEVTGHFYSSNLSKIWSGTLKTKIIDNQDLYLSIRGGMESYTYEHPSYGTDRFVTDVAILSQLNVNRNIKLHNNAEIAFTSGSGSTQRFENGVTLYLNPYNSLQANFNSVLSEQSKIFSLEGAYKLVISSQMNYVLYITRRLNNPAIHFENVLEYYPVRNLNLKGNFIYNTGTSNPDAVTYTGTWLAFKAEQSYSTFSVFADLIHELDLAGDGALKIGINVNL